MNKCGREDNGSNKKVFGKSPEGREISLYTLSNSKGMQAKVTDLGANLVGILVPDAQGVTADVTLGFDSVDRYYKNYSFFGAVIGPCANRTAGAAYTLDGVDYRMDQNDGPNNLHTHIELGFHKRIWMRFREITVSPFLWRTRMDIWDSPDIKRYP